MTTVINVERRHFLKASALVGGGLFVGLYLPNVDAVAAELADQTTAVLNAHVRIGADGVIEIMSVAPEIGQGIKTSLPMVICEELDADWSTVTVLQAPVNPDAYGRQSAGGSRSTPIHFDEHRRVGAAARLMLLQAAAKTWRVALDELGTKSGVVTHTTTGRQISYAELANQAAKLPVPPLDTVPLKDPATFSLIGQFTAGVDNDDLVNGRPLFGIDIQLPDMLYATYHKCPVFGGKVASVDLESIKALPGIRHAFVIDSSAVDSGIAIVADSWWQAEKARRQLKVEWDEGKAKQQNSADFDKQALALWQQPPQDTSQNLGDIDAAFSNASKIVEAEYRYPFLAHGQLEPINCTAHWQNGQLTLWAPTQNPVSGQRQTAAALGINPNKVIVKVTRMGGGFGRRLFNDHMVEVALIAQQVGVPVKLLWNRQDDFQHDYYRPAGYHKFKAAIDDNGQLQGFSDHFVSFGNDGKMLLAAGMHSAEFPCGFVPNLKFSHSLIEAQIPTGWLRAPISNATAYVFQCMLDEVATAAGQDPLAYQLALLQRKGAKPQAGFESQRMAAVLKRVGEISGWGQATAKFHGKGVACYYSHSGYFAEVVEASVDSRGAVSVEKVWVVGDVGQFIVNPSGALQQVRGSVLEGLSQALYQQVIIDGGAQVSNYHQHKIMAMNAVPEVEVEFLKTENPTTGLGEPALPPVIPALCNALFAATGKRVRSLPIQAEMFA